MYIRCPPRRYGVYRGKPEHGDVVSLLMLGEVLISLCSGGFLITWELGHYEEPKVSPGPLAKGVSRAPGE